MTTQRGSVGSFRGIYNKGNNGKERKRRQKAEASESTQRIRKWQVKAKVGQGRLAGTA